MRKLWVVIAGSALVGCGSVEGDKPKTDANTTPMVDSAVADAPRSCPVGVTAMCTGADLVTCDAQGAITEMHTCPNGCNSNEARCNKVAPSNGLAAALDDAANAPDATFVGPTTIDTDQATITDMNGARVLPTQTINTTPVPTFVIKVKSLTSGGDITVKGTKALAIVSDGDVSIGHVLNVSASLQIPGPGAVTNEAGCRGGNAPAGNTEGGGGGGGGGFGTAGGAGGTGGSPTVAGGVAGGVTGNAELTPLRGGCPGGKSYLNSGSTVPGGGGGAIQIVSNTAIRLTDGGAIAANGGGARYTSAIFILCAQGSPCGNGEGAGAGGGVLIEAPVVDIAANSGVYTNGGGGMCGVNGNGVNGTLMAAATPGQVCSGQTGNGGNGGGGTANATNGVNKTGADAVGGGGGGGKGRIRINVAVGTTFSPTGDVSGVMTVGALGTR